jgi:hypothetical protein
MYMRPSCGLPAALYWTFNYSPHVEGEKKAAAEWYTRPLNELSPSKMDGMSLGRFSLVSLTLSFAVLIRAAVLLGGQFIYFPLFWDLRGFGRLFHGVSCTLIHGVNTSRPHRLNW